MKSAILSLVVLAATTVTAESRLRAALVDNYSAPKQQYKQEYKQEYGIKTNTPFRCGSSWFDANDYCGDACPSGKDYECPYGEKCFRDLQKTCDSYDSYNSGYQQKQQYNDNPYYNKYSNSPTKYEAPKYEPKYEQKQEYKQEYGIKTNTPFRCGKSWFDANDYCGAACPSGKDYECSYGEKCFRDLQKTCDGKQKEYYEAPKQEYKQEYKEYKQEYYQAPKQEYYEAPKQEYKQEYKPEYSGGGSSSSVQIGAKCTLVSNNNLNFGCTSDNKIAVCGPAGPNSKWQFSDDCGKYKTKCSVSASYAGCA
ncbi:hypothetical protein HDU81_005694 [Chytriomyces hyalinus]|nr:hypothetical protein HDU81_005694 [Chytriomyces hyalinus]